MTKSKKPSDTSRPEAVEATQQFMRAVIESLSSLPTGSSKHMFFPYGITKVNVSVQAGGINITLDIEGPQSGPAVATSAIAIADNSLTFTITSRTGKKAHGTLEWPSKSLTSAAVSGDSGHDAINVGIWKGIAFQERPGDTPYCDSSGNCWFSVFQDAYGRTGIGIHPDGGVPDATLGCIGLSTPNTTVWHDALKGAGGLITCEVIDRST
jgi:hypothetical protein